MFGAVAAAGVLYISSGLMKSELYLSLAIILLVFSTFILSLAYFLHQNLQILIRKLIDSNAVRSNDLYDSEIYPVYQDAFQIQFLSLNILGFIATLIVIDRLLLIRDCASCDETYLFFMILGLASFFAGGQFVKLVKSRKKGQSQESHNQPVLRCTFVSMPVGDGEDDHKHIYLRTESGINIDANDYIQVEMKAIQDAKARGDDPDKVVYTSPEVMKSFKALQARLIEALETSKPEGIK